MFTHKSATNSTIIVLKIRVHRVLRDTERQRGRDRDRETERERGRERERQTERQRERKKVKCEKMTNNHGKSEKGRERKIESKREW